MIKYVELVQRPEREEQVDILTHQKWSGANLMDKQVGHQRSMFRKIALPLQVMKVFFSR